MNKKEKAFKENIESIISIVRNFRNYRNCKINCVQHKHVDPCKKGLRQIGPLSLKIDILDYTNDGKIL